MGGKLLIFLCAVAMLVYPTGTTAHVAAEPLALGAPQDITLPAPLRVDVAALPVARTEKNAGTVPPFLPRDAQQYAQAKQEAAAGRAGRPSGITTLKRAAASSAGVEIPTQSVGFPLVSRNQQVGWFGNDQNVEPPDPQIAAGLSFLVAMDNDTGTIWRKDGTLLSHFDLHAFFGTQSIGYFVSDPRVLYDPGSARWFASVMAFNQSFNSAVLLAVSTSIDPTMTWNIFTLKPPTATLFDQPISGTSDDKLAVSWNDYNSTTSAFIDTQTLVLEKAELAAGLPPHAAVFTIASIFRIVPVTSEGLTTTQWAAFDNGHGGTIGVISFTGRPISRNVVATLFPLSTSPTAVPPPAEQPGSGTPPTIDTGDDRFISAVWQDFGKLWVSGNDACTPAGDSNVRCCLRLIEVDTTGTTPTVVQNFDAGRVGSYLYHPAVALDVNGDLLVVYTASDVNTFAGIEAVDQPVGAPAATVETPLSVRPGNVTYTGSRWGDYSGAAVDPVAPRVWVVGEYSNGAFGDWGTAAAAVYLQPLIASVSPSSGPFSGGQSVTISGQEFLPGATVQFGSASPQTATFVNNGQLTTTTPAGLGTVDVTVTNPGGFTSTRAVGAYTYNPAPDVQYFAWFDRISSPGFQGDNVHVVNPGSSSSATVVVNIPGSPGCLSKALVPPQGEQIFTCTTGFGGPVTVNSDLPVLASQRVQYFQSFNEVVAQAPSAAQTTLFFTWFDRISSPGFLGDNIHVVNPFGGSTAHVTVSIPGCIDQTGAMLPGNEEFFTCSTGFGGPVKVVSDQPVLASQRVQYFQSFNEVVAQPASAAQTALDFTWFDRISSPGFLGDNVHVVNPGAASANVTVGIPGEPGCNPGGTIAGGGEAIFSCSTGFGGPVNVTSDQPVLASQRVQYFQSFNEVVAEPPSAARQTTYFTWFDRISSLGFVGDNVHVINPGGVSAHVMISIPGQPGCSPSGTIAGGGEAIFSCSTGFGGPVKVTSDQPVLVSQRVQYFQSFNEVLGLTP